MAYSPGISCNLLFIPKYWLQMRILTFAPFDSNADQTYNIELALLKIFDIIKLNQLKIVYDFYFLPKAQVYKRGMWFRLSVCGFRFA